MSWLYKLHDRTVGAIVGLTCTPLHLSETASSLPQVSRVRVYRQGTSLLSSHVTYTRHPKIWLSCLDRHGMSSWSWARGISRSTRVCGGDGTRICVSFLFLLSSRYERVLHGDCQGDDQGRTNKYLNSFDFEQVANLTIVALSTTSFVSPLLPSGFYLQFRSMWHSSSNFILFRHRANELKIHHPEYNTVYRTFISNTRKAIWWI